MLPISIGKIVRRCGAHHIVHIKSYYCNLQRKATVLGLHPLKLVTHLISFTIVMMNSRYLNHHSTTWLSLMVIDGRCCAHYVLANTMLASCRTVGIITIIEPLGGQLPGNKGYDMLSCQGIL
jgi:hypothetical protein